MAEREGPLLAGLKRELSLLAVQLGELIRLRAELAQLEVRAAVGAMRRLIASLAAGAGMAIVGLPLLAVAAAELLDGTFRLPRWGWLLALAIILIGLGLGGCWLAWRRFQREFTGMEQTLEELREDVRWLCEWTGRED
ncbi:MAG TPA: hypothetical protein EYP56_16515 [Planctomycetaceae bacterium]|nr:hypothetical protein [Planctomycetaceae bacterium]